MVLQLLGALVISALASSSAFGGTYDNSDNRLSITFTSSICDILNKSDIPTTYQDSFTFNYTCWGRVRNAVDSGSGNNYQVFDTYTSMDYEITLGTYQEVYQFENTLSQGAYKFNYGYSTDYSLTYGNTLYHDRYLLRIARSYFLNPSSQNLGSGYLISDDLFTIYNQDSKSILYNDWTEWFFGNSVLLEAPVNVSYGDNELIGCMAFDNNMKILDEDLSDEYNFNLSASYFSAYLNYWFPANTSVDDVYTFLNKVNTINFLQEDSLNEGYNSGFEEGYNQGYYDGRSDVGDAYTNGYNNGYDNGRQVGFNEGVESAETYTFSNLFGSIADTPIIVVRSLFDFDLFVTSMLTVVLSLFTALILFYLLRKLL